MPHVYTPKICPVWARAVSYVGLLVFSLLAGTGLSAVPAPEKLLPDDTLLVLTAPDFAKLRANWEQLPLGQLWADVAMKPFRDDFVKKWKEEFIQPLERELDIKVSDYISLVQGQITFAFTQNGWQGGAEPTPGVVLLVDTKDKSSQLKKNLATLRKKWVDAGKAIKTTKVRDYEFTTVPVSTNDVPKTLRKFFPKSSPVHELGDENAAKPEVAQDQLLIGQVDSLLILSSSMNCVEKVVARISGRAVPALSEVAAYQQDQASLFRDSPFYAWVNLKPLLEGLTRNLGEKKENPDAPNPFDVKPDKVLRAFGLNGLRTLAFTFQPSREGSLLQFFVGAPESTRQGLLKILAGEPREARPPAFVPADAVKFQRWRIDGQKAWQTLQRMISDISPQWLNGINFLIDTANTAAKEKDPGFDLKKNLIGNLGDDLISYEKAPRGDSPAERRSPPSLFLLGSPNAESLAASLKSVLVYASQQPGSPPEEREFLGRKIYSVSLKGMMMPFGAAAGPATPRTLSYAASGGYVAFSSDPSMVEECLRSSEGVRNTLRERAGLAEAAQKVTGPGSSLFGYENQAETTRIFVESLRKNSGSAGAASSPAANLIPGALNVPATIQNLKGLVDFSLLPSFDSIAKYFSFSVYGGSATGEGLSLKFFSPVPPGVKAAGSSQH